jgi:pilus assembly protein FimV
MFFKSTKSVVKFRNTLIGTALLVVAIGSSALSIGRARGNAVLGQPLDLSFEVRLDSPDDSSAPCISADILHGDTRVDPSRTRFSVEPAGSPQDVVIRMRSSVVVDEPIVSVVLRVGCQQNTTRRYDFLADFPLESRATVPAMNASLAPPPAVTAPLATAPAPGAESAPAATAPVVPRPAAAPRAAAPAPAARLKPSPAPAPARAVPRAAPKAAAPVARAPAVPAPPSAAAKPRLKLESVEVVAERNAALKPSQELLTTPAADNAAQRAEAAAMWRAMNSTPEEVAAQARKLEEAEAANKALREQSARNDARLTDLQTRLQKIEEERYANGVTYGLAALLLAVAALAAYLWVKRREAETMAPEWWRNRSGTTEEVHSQGLGVVSTGAAMSGPMSVPGQQQRVNKVDVDLDRVEAAPASVHSDLAALAPVAAPAPVPRRVASRLDASHAGPRVVRSVNPEELFDVQQHAEFFVSLGQYDQAIAVLKKHIAENPESSPLAYLDLLKIYHTLSRIEDYNQLRSDFNRIFNGRVPGFTGFTNEGKLLDEYPEVMSDIQSLWLSPQALELIEEYLYPQPEGEQGAEIFDLAAFRELLMLHAIGKSGMVPAVDNQDAADRIAQARRSRVAPISSEPSEFGPSELSSVSAVLSSQTMELYTPSGEPLSDLPPLPRADRMVDVDLSEDIPGDSGISDSQFDSIDSPIEAQLRAQIDASAPDLELPSILPEEAVPHLDSASAPLPGDKPVKHSNLVDFNLFDPDVEKDITPKATRH